MLSFILESVFSKLLMPGKAIVNFEKKFVIDPYHRIHSDPGHLHLMDRGKLMVGGGANLGAAAGIGSGTTYLMTDHNPKNYVVIPIDKIKKYRDETLDTADKYRDDYLDTYDAMNRFKDAYNDSMDQLIDKYKTYMPK